MFDRLNEAEKRYRELEAMLEDPGVMSDMNAYLKIRKEYSSLEPAVSGYRAWLDARRRRKEAEELLSSNDRELAALAEEELISAGRDAEEAEERLRELLAPSDPDGRRNAILEIRAAAGGEEACLFAADLFRMYSMYAAKAGFRITVPSENRTDLGGYKRIEAAVEGDGVYSRLRYESGIHEVKRVPLTEAQGRIQTSTVTVAVIPEAEEVDVNIEPSDIVFDSMKSSGAGGQHINKTESAVRLTHIPTGIVIECQEERSQFQNRDRAMKMLRAKLYEIKKREQQETIAGTRRTMVGSGDRSERIRVYRYQENIVRDTRLKNMTFGLEKTLNGDIGEMIDALAAADNAARLASGE